MGRGKGLYRGFGYVAVDGREIVGVCGWAGKWRGEKDGLDGWVGGGCETAGVGRRVEGLAR